MIDFPLSHPYELGRLGHAGAKVEIAATPEECARIAAWAGVESVELFRAGIALRRLSSTHFVYEAALDCMLVQSCVVTLDPVPSRIERDFKRELVLSEAASHAAEPAAVDEDGREEIGSLRYDLAVPLLEELALAIDPYPRAPGVEFQPPADAADAPAPAFAVLKQLKPGS
ncbi:MAG: hypothetical protein JO261_07075 [Alphaproteobacteria bacterium]|nr:hypothetical protein [Alphaproteobacteria bacterium]MBV9693444.1 hypothetical protein [Alphaproteobacteria bacterium]